MVIALLLTLGATTATTEPAAIEAKRAEVARIQGELDGINMQVEQAAEAYNGARYSLGIVDERVAANQRVRARTEKDLKESRRILAGRLRGLYATPEPGLIEVLVASGSLTAVADQMDMLDRVGQRDAGVVGRLRKHKARLAELRAQLIADRDKAAAAVAEREQQKQRVEGLLDRRKAVLDGASNELKSLLKAEEERKAREAAAQAALVRQRQAEDAAAASAAEAPAATTAEPGSGSAVPATPAAASVPIAPPADGGANAAAASYALQFLGVPYVWGGASPSGFDCSGLATYVFAKYGKSVPHYTGAIWSAFPQVPRDQLQVGDLVFFHGLGHMGIYLGGDQFVHAPHTGDVVKVSQFFELLGLRGSGTPLTLLGRWPARETVLARAHPAEDEVVRQLRVPPALVGPRPHRLALNAQAHLGHCAYGCAYG